MDQFIEYTCPHCGESIQIVVDPSGGAYQTYTEDCPVCCNPNLLHIEFDREAGAYVTAEAE